MYRLSKSEKIFEIIIEVVSIICIIALLYVIFFTGKPYKNKNNNCNHMRICLCLNHGYSCDNCQSTTHCNCY